MKIIINLMWRLRRLLIFGHEGKKILLKYDDAIINKEEDSIKWGVRWFIFIPVMLSLLTAAFWIYNNQGKMFFSYRNEKSGWLCDEGGSLVDAAVLDGFKLKKIKIDEVQEIKGDCAGLKQGGLRYSYFDLDNDGQREIVLDGRWDNGNVVEYYLKDRKRQAGFHTG